MAIVTFRDVSFSYDGRAAISGLSFSVNCGDYLCIVGENGSGKSTLLKVMLGLKRPETGQVLIAEGLKKNEIGYLPQQQAAQRDFPASAFEVVLSGRLSGCGLRPFYSREDKSCAESNMKCLDIYDLRLRCFGELSGGEQRRVLLARALCATRKLLILDEPIAGLDPQSTKDLYRQISEINRLNGITIIMVSHDVHCATKYASSILHLKNKQLFFGTVADYAKSGVGKDFLGSAAYD